MVVDDVADGTTEAGRRMPTLFRSDFERRETLDDGERRSTAKRARLVDGVELAMTGRYGYEPGSNRHAVEYVDAGGGARWLSIGGRPMPEPDAGTVRHVSLKFTDGTRR